MSTGRPSEEDIARATDLVGLNVEKDVAKVTDLTGISSGKVVQAT